MIKTTCLIGYSALLLLSACKTATPFLNGSGESVMTIHRKTELVRAAVLSGDKKKRPRFHNDRFYYWYRSNEVYRTQGGADGNLLHGSFTVFYLNYELKEKGQLDKGLRTGPWKQWYPGGVLASVTNWKEGRQHGLQFYYDQHGQLYKISRLRNGIQHGRTRFYEEGRQTELKIFRQGKELPQADELSSDNDTTRRKKNHLRLRPDRNEVSDGRGENKNGRRGRPVIKIGKKVKSRGKARLPDKKEEKVIRKKIKSEGPGSEA